MKLFTPLLLSALLVLHLTACQKMTLVNPLPRNQSLEAFDPHRKDFTCTHEASAVPPIDPQADEWHQEALYLTRSSLWPNQRDWKKAEQLWTQAAERKHWKAMMNLAGLYETGRGEGAFAVLRNPFKAVEIVESAMKLGIPAAYDKMGNFHAGYIGDVEHDGKRAWAFWARAADMGNPQSLTHIGKSLAATYDNPEEGFWGNMPVALQMLQCAVSQGFGEAAYELGSTLQGTDASIGEDNARALAALHEGLKFGSENAANSLFAKFDGGDQVVGRLKDPVRARRYKTLADALYHNPDLRFPNLDRVLPLPPAPLPQWDGNPDSLIDAAKAVRVTPKAQQVSGHLYPSWHRAHIPPGEALQVPTRLGPIPELPGFTSILSELPGATGMARAIVAGYWQPTVSPARPTDSIFLSRMRRDVSNRPPLRFKQGERMQLDIGNTNLPYEDTAHYFVTWHFMGWAVPQWIPQDWRVKAGTARAIADVTRIHCRGNQICPQSGIWQPHVMDEAHPLFRTLGSPTWLASEGWKWQAFVQQGARMPSLRAKGMPAEDTQVDWRLMLACEPGFDVPVAG